MEFSVFCFKHTFQDVNDSLICSKIPHNTRNASNEAGGLKINAKKYMFMSHHQNTQ